MGLAYSSFILLIPPPLEKSTNVNDKIGHLSVHSKNNPYDQKLFLWLFLIQTLSVGLSLVNRYYFVQGKTAAMVKESNVDSWSKRRCESQLWLTTAD